MLEQSVQADDIVAFTQSLYRGIQRFGIRRVQEKLRELYPSENTETLRKQILSEVTSVYGVSMKSILRSKKRGTVTEAKVMAIILIHKHQNITNAEIATMFGCDPSIIGKRINAFNGIIIGKVSDLDNQDSKYVKIYSAPLFLENFKSIDQRIELWKNQK